MRRARAGLTVYPPSRTLEPLARLALYCVFKQKYQKGFIHRKLTVPTSEREGKLSNPRGRAARAMHGENLRKFTESRARTLRAMQWFSYNQVYSKAHRPAVNQSRIKIANSDGAKKTKQYKTKFILLFTHHCKKCRGNLGVKRYDWSDIPVLKATAFCQTSTAVPVRPYLGI